MSKSRNLAGAHIGCCLASPELIWDLAIVKGVLNPFNISDINQAIGTAAMKDTSYLRQCTAAIQETRSAMTQALRELDFTVLESHTNFLFITHPQLCRQRLQSGTAKSRHPCPLVRSGPHPEFPAHHNWHTGRDAPRTGSNPGNSPKTSSLKKINGYHKPAAYGIR
jgi:histidinol-phosphate/aromatic aminotransferase/cobyric acid decarboxylase-like protein